METYSAALGQLLYHERRTLKPCRLLHLLFLAFCGTSSWIALEYYLWAIVGCFWWEFLHPHRSPCCKQTLEIACELLRLKVVQHLRIRLPRSQSLYRHRLRGICQTYVGISFLLVAFGQGSLMSCRTSTSCASCSDLLTSHGGVESGCSQGLCAGGCFIAGIFDCYLATLKISSSFFINLIFTYLLINIL